MGLTIYFHSYREFGNVGIATTITLPGLLPYSTHTYIGFHSIKIFKKKIDQENIIVSWSEMNYLILLKGSKKLKLHF